MMKKLTDPEIPIQSSRDPRSVFQADSANLGPVSGVATCDPPKAPPPPPATEPVGNSAQRNPDNAL
jgi:hypothetical protein